jgi:hypothetical protein
MNERIRELAIEAGLKVESWMTNPPKPFQILGSTEQFEKLAELIVRECADIATNRYQRLMDGGKAIKEHFGVK